MKKCRKCGNPMNDDSRFCTNCGYDTRDDMKYNSSDTIKGSNSVFSHKHSSVNHNCRVESINGQETERKKSVSKKKALGFFTVFLIILIAVPLCIGIILGLFYIMDETDYVSSEYSDEYYYSYLDCEIETGNYVSCYYNPSADLRFDYESMGMNAYDSQQIAGLMGAKLDAENNKAYQNLENGETVIYDAYFENELSGERIAVSILNGDFNNADLGEYAIHAANDLMSEMDGLNAEVNDIYDLYICGQSYVAVDVVSYPDNLYASAGTTTDTFCFISGENSILCVHFTLNETENDVHSVVYNYFY